MMDHCGFITAHGRRSRVYRRLLIGRAVFGERSELLRPKEEAPSEWSFSSLEEDEETDDGWWKAPSLTEFIALPITRPGDSLQ